MPIIKGNKIEDLDALLLNMKAGLLPKELTESEVKLLEERYGAGWFDELGYDDFIVERSKFDTNKLYK
jgi:hypothetical protein